MLYGDFTDDVCRTVYGGLNPYFFGKCSTARNLIEEKLENRRSLNPYFFGKCSTAKINFLKEYLRTSLNPYFFGKCSTAQMKEKCSMRYVSLNPYFFGKCSTAVKTL